MKPLPFLATVVFIGTCLQATAASGQDLPAPAAFDAVTLERGGGCFFGKCRVYTIQIRADGSVDDDVKGHAKVNVGKDGKLRPSAVALLAAAVQYADFDNLRDRYDRPDDGCTSLGTDQAWLKISVQRGAATKTVRYYEGCHGPTVPSRELAWLADTIDFVSTMQYWVPR